MALTAERLRRLWVRAGGPPRYANVMSQIALRESGGRRGAQNLTGPDHSIGLWQINQLAHRGRYGNDQQLKNPLANAKAAVAIFQASRQAGQDPLRPWSTYNPATDIKLIGTGQSTRHVPPRHTPPGLPSVTTDGFDKAGYEKARRAALVGSFIAGRKGTDSVLFRSGVLTTQQPNIDDFVHPELRFNARAAATPATGSKGNSPLTAPGSRPDGIRALIERANKIDQKHYPYVWGGGHAVSGKADRGTGRDPGIGFDCSGAVAAVLGVDPRHSSQFAQWGKPGRAKGGRGVTVYANGTHVLMEINNHFFGTSGANPGGGAGWIPRSAISESYLKNFTARHM